MFWFETTVWPASGPAQAFIMESTSCPLSNVAAPQMMAECYFFSPGMLRKLRQSIQIIVSCYLGQVPCTAQLLARLCFDM